ncbi:MAG: hypothetical protein H8E12_16920 [Rhodobacteraceae bacterium]|nr:hypothetical protein [Paracoccaceae bacterium]
MDKLAELILGKYVNLAEEFLTARFNSYTPEDLEKVAGYLIETDRKSSEVFEKQGIFSQA